jgi:serine protease Do
MKRSTQWSVALLCLIVAASGGYFLGGQGLQGQVAAPPAIPKELTSYRDVVKKVLPAVVSIDVKARPTAKGRQPSPRLQPRGRDLPIPEEFRRFFEEFEWHQFEMPERSPHLGFGSGFLIDPKGVILTNNHVVEGADSVEIQLKDGRKFVSRDIKADPKTDLAIIRLDAKDNLPYLELGDSDAMEIGDRVLAVGAPFGLTGTVTHGIISAKGRNGLNMNMYEDFVQTDAAINPGNSGGPLVNLEGKVVGINSAIKSRSGGFQGVGLAVASNLAKSVVPQLLKDGTVKRGYLGVQIKDLDPEIAPRLGLKDQSGVVIAAVHENTPAAKAGLKDGDVLTSLAGKPIKDGRELQRMVAGLPLGKPVEVTVVRDGKPVMLQVVIEEQPREFGSARVPLRPGPRSNPDTVNLDKIGVEVADLTPELAEQLGYPRDAKGVVVASVEPGSAADLSGLRKGALIVKVDKVPVPSAAAAKDALAKASLDKGVLLQVQTPQGGTSYLVLKVEASASK